MKKITKTLPLHQPRGIAMVLVLITLAMATVLGLTFLNTQSTTSSISENVSRQASARGIAESAMNITIDHIRNNADWRTTYTDGIWVSNQSLNNGTFNVTVNDGTIDNTGQITGDGDLANSLTDNIVITATGYFNGVTHTVKSEITPTPTSTTPPTRVLMVVPNPASLAADDLARQTLLQSWNMTVTLIDDSSSQSALSTAYANADVVYVSQNATDSTLGGNLLSAPIGVVTEQISSVVTNMGLAQSVQTNTQSQIDIQDNTHYITSTFDAGLLSITSSDQSLSSLGVVPGDMTALAHHASNNSIALGVMNAGQTLNTGVNTPARRVVLPWGSSSFSPDSLTAEGKTLLERALIWSGDSPIITNSNLGLAVTESVELEDDGIIDSFNSTLGAYGGANVGPEAIISTNSTGSGDIEIKDDSKLHGSAYGGPGGDPNTIISVSSDATLTGTRSTLTQAIDIPTVTEPTGMPANQGELTYNSGTTTLTGDIHCDEMEIKNDAIVHISGHVRILCEDEFEMKDNSELRILANSSVTIWAKGGDHPVKLKDNARLNINTANPALATFYILSGDKFEAEDTSQVYARVIAPTGSSKLENDAQFYGTFLGEKIKVKDDAQLHHDIGINPDPSGYTGTTEEDDGNNDPQLILEYKMEEVPLPTPQLVGHWKLDEAINSGSGSGFGISAGNEIKLKKNSFIDSYNSQTGPYGGGNISSQAEVSTNSTSNHKIKLESHSHIKGNAYCGVGGNPSSVIKLTGASSVTGTKAALSSEIDIPSDVSAPGGLPSSQGHVDITSSETWSSDKRYEKLHIKGTAIVTINGDITVLCDEKFEIKDAGQLIIPDGSSLTLYVKDKLEVEGTGKLNPDTQGAGRLYVYLIDDGELKLEDSAIMCGIVYAEDKFKIEDNAQFYGTAMSLDKIELKDNAQIHIDLAQTGGGGGGGTLIATDQLSNDGTYHNTPLGEQPGHTDTAVQFDGSNDYLKIPHNDTYLLNSGAVSFWFNADSVSTNQSLFSKDSSGYDTGGHLDIWITASKVEVRLQSTSASYLLQSGTVSAGTWNHVIFSWGYSGMKLYINGTLADTDSYTGGMGTNSGGIGNYEPIAIGATTKRSGNGVVTPLSDYFQGLLDEYRIYDQPLDATQATNLYSDQAPGASSSSGYLVKDTSGFGTALDLTVDNTANVTWAPSGGITFNAATKAASDTDASKISDALEATDELTFEIIFTPDNLTQNGPARLVSFSENTSNRNFTFGQDTDQYVWRQRTSTTGNNGTPDIDSASVLTTTQQHIVITWDGDNVKMYRNGTLEITEARDGVLSSWDDSYKMFLGNEADDSRPWLGELKRVAIYDRALNAFQVQDVFDGNTPRSTTDTQNITFHVRWYENP